MYSGIIFENLKLNIECGYGTLTNAIFMAKNRKSAADCVIKSVEIMKLENEYQQTAQELFTKLTEKKEKLSFEANTQITELKQQARQRKKMILKEIESASKRYQDATKAVELAKMELNIPAFEIPVISEESKISALNAQLQRINEHNQKLREKKAEWESILNELAEIEKNRVRHTPQKKKNQINALLNLYV